jgi:hypothetical protein
VTANTRYRKVIQQLVNLRLATFEDGIERRSKRVVSPAHTERDIVDERKKGQVDLGAHRNDHQRDG